MPYIAEISRENPSCFLFLVDQSTSMEEEIAAGEATQVKANGVAAPGSKSFRRGHRWRGNGTVPTLDRSDTTGFGSGIVHVRVRLKSHPPAGGA